MSFAVRLLSPIDRLIAALVDPARRERTVVGVLAMYVVLWTLTGALIKANQDIHYDMAGVAAWSRELALGFPQHPPLAPWLVRGWFSVFPVADWSYYLLGMICAGVALWCAWGVFARFLQDETRVLALALLTLVPFYNFHALKFDHNVVLLPLWAATTLWFIRSFETRTAGWAVLAGVGAAAAMLAKYWSIYLLAGLALAALVDARRRVYFRSAAPWITTAVGALLLAPHVAWLVANDFIPMHYAVGVHTPVSFAATARSVAGYLAGTAGYAALPVLLVLAASRPTLTVLQDMLKPQEPARRFAATAFWTPLLLPAVVVLAIGLELNPVWSMSGFTLLPVVLLSSPLIADQPGRDPRHRDAGSRHSPIDGGGRTWHRHRQAPRRRHHLDRGARRLLAQRVEQEWRRISDQPLRLVGGDLDLANTVAFYLPDRPSTLPVSEPQLAPWASDERIARDGIAIVCHAIGPLCLHRLVQVPTEAIEAKGPPGHRVSVEIARTFFGIAGAAGALRHRHGAAAPLTQAGVRTGNECGYSAARTCPGTSSDSLAASASVRNSLTASSESSAPVFDPSAGNFLRTSAGAVMIWQPISSASMTLNTSRVEAQMISTFLVARASLTACRMIGR